MERQYNFWVVVEPTKGVAGEWTAHVLEVDVVTQGRSIKHAFDMAIEAAAIVVGDDLRAKRDPLTRRAPDRFWKRLQRVVEGGSPVRLSALRQKVARRIMVAGQVHLRLTPARARSVRGDVPFAFKRALTKETAAA
ncbi:MAG: hypothetical protein IT384_03395 [Deltaproteobacteria bacterium]|nr:hypothetical protein [Deltaproteobacteria bacterium]